MRLTDVTPDFDAIDGTTGLKEAIGALMTFVLIVAVCIGIVLVLPVFLVKKADPKQPSLAQRKTITVARERLSRHRAGNGGADEQLRRALVTSVEALLRGLRSADSRRRLGRTTTPSTSPMS